MADDMVVDTGAGDDDVARLVALTERQHELWNLLRDTKDEQVRNNLLDELTVNREELSRLKTKVSSEVDHPPTVPPVISPRGPGEDLPRSVGEQLRSDLLSPDPRREVAPAQPPPPPPLPPPVTTPVPPLPASPQHLSNERFSKERVSKERFSIERLSEEGLAEEPVTQVPDPVTADPVSPRPLERSPERPQERPPERPSERPPEGRPEAPQPPAAIAPDVSAGETEATVGDHDDDDSLLLPEKTPFRSREDDIAALRARRRDVAPAGDAPDEEPVEIDAAVLEARLQQAHETIREMNRIRPHALAKRSRPRRWFPIVAIIVALAAVTAAGWYLFLFDRDSEGDESRGTTTTVPAVEDGTPIGDQIQAVIDGMGFDTVVAEERNGTVFLSGSVDFEANRTAIIGAAEALAGAIPIDADDLSVSILDDDLRLASLDAIAAAGFEKVNVAVSGGVATLTGVTPEEGAAALVDVVRSVDGITQVVDMTETADRSIALSNELDRIVAVTPIVFESGQSSLTALQQRTLDSAAEIILAYDGPIVTVVGYTDAAGTTEGNEAISLERAEQVRDYLVGQGVPTERLAVDARGESGSTGSESVAGLERRVEFEVGYAVPAGSDASFRIGIVAPSARDDLAFTQSIVDAAAVISAERDGVGVDISDELLVTADAEAAIRGYAAAGYDLVIAHGSQYGTSVAAIAPEFPNTAFAWGTAADTFDLPNVSAYEVSADEGGYVLGTIAARLSETGVVGVVGPLELGDAALYIGGFGAGVRATDAQVEVLTAYTGSFSDLALAAETAAGHIEAGADVLTGSAQMVVGAVGVAADNGAVWFGNQSNQTELAPDLVAASQVYHWEVALRQIIDGLSEGVLGGETYTLNLANGGIIIEYNAGYDLDGDIASAAAEVANGIIDGSIVTGF